MRILSSIFSSFCYLFYTFTPPIIYSCSSRQHFNRNSFEQICSGQSQTTGSAKISGSHQGNRTKRCHSGSYKELEEALVDAVELPASYDSLKDCNVYYHGGIHFGIPIDPDCRCRRENGIVRGYARLSGREIGLSGHD